MYVLVPQRPLYAGIVVHGGYTGHEEGDTTGEDEGACSTPPSPTALPNVMDKPVLFMVCVARIKYLYDPLKVRAQTHPQSPCPFCWGVENEYETRKDAVVCYWLASCAMRVMLDVVMRVGMCRDVQDHDASQHIPAHPYTSLHVASGRCHVSKRCHVCERCPRWRRIYIKRS